MRGFGYGAEDDGYDDLPDEEQIIDEVLGENARARELRLMRAALEERRALFQREQERTNDEVENKRLNAKINELTRQIEAVRQEEAISEFVEGSVRVTLHKPAFEDAEDY